MKQSCAGNMIWRHKVSKIKNGKSKTTNIFFFILNLWKWKSFFTILSLKKQNPEERIFAVYRYSRGLLASTLSPKVLSNNLSLWLSYDGLTPAQVLIFSNLILHNFILVSKINPSVSKLFIFIWIQCAKSKMWKSISVNIRYINVV